MIVNMVDWNTTYSYIKYASRSISKPAELLKVGNFRRYSLILLLIETVVSPQSLSHNE